jgi:hypothetical protein
LGRVSGRELITGRLGVLLIVILLLSALYVTTFYVSVVDVFDSSKQESITSDQILFKVLLKESESFEGVLTLRNFESSSKDVTLSTSLTDIVLFEDSPIQLTPGSNEIPIEFKAPSSSGIYVGVITVESSKSRFTIPVVIEIETSTVAFDTNLNLITDSITPNSDLSFEVRLFNFIDSELNSIDIEYTILDEEGTLVYTETENVILESQVSVNKDISIPNNFPEGSYVLGAKIVSDDTVGTSTKVFEVSSRIEDKSSVVFLSLCSTTDPVCWLSLIILLVLLFFIGAYVYFFVGLYIYGTLNPRFLSSLKRAERQSVIEDKKFVKTKVIEEKKKVKKKAKRSWFFFGRKKKAVIKPKDNIKKLPKKQVKRGWHFFAKKKNKVSQSKLGHFEKKKLLSDIPLPELAPIVLKKDKKTIARIKKKLLPKTLERELVIPEVLEFSKRIVDPFEKMKVMMDICFKNVERERLDITQIQYKQMQHLFVKLSDKEQRLLYDSLVTLQNKIVHLRMKLIEKSLKPKKRKRKK